MKNRIDTSRQKTPWDSKDEKTILQNFVSKKYKENYKAKHPKLIDTDEAELLNSITINNCRYCDSENIKKNGKSKNCVQIYYCKDCGRKINPTTGTIFENHKISITEWIEFLLDIFNYGSTSLTSRVNKNSMNTSTYWLQKVFLILREYHRISKDKQGGTRLLRKAHRPEPVHVLSIYLIGCSSLLPPYNLYL